MQAETVYERIEGVEVSEVPDGYVVYDAVNDRVHFLNLTAAIVLELCDGTRTARDISRVLEEGYELDTSSFDDVGTCLASLETEKLLRKCR